MVQELVERIRNHDQQAMRQLYQRYVEQLTSVCYRYVPTEEDTKDVLQNSFVKIFTLLPAFEYRGEVPFMSWMTRIVVHEAIGLLRERKKLRFVDLDKISPQQLGEDAEPDASPLLPDELHSLISELPDGYRLVLNLYVFEGYSHKQIAELLGIREGTSASQLYFAKKLLASKIKKLINDRQ